MCLSVIHVFSVFFFNDTATTEIYTLSLHDALPISLAMLSEQLADAVATAAAALVKADAGGARSVHRSEEHTSELQSQSNLVCRLLLEKTKTASRRQVTS